MPDWMFGVISFFGSALLLVLVILIAGPIYRRYERNRRREALNDYFEAKERYEKCKNDR